MRHLAQGIGSPVFFIVTSDPPHHVGDDLRIGVLEVLEAPRVLMGPWPWPWRR